MGILNLNVFVLHRIKYYYVSAWIFCLYLTLGFNKSIYYKNRNDKSNNFKHLMVLYKK